MSKARALPDSCTATPAPLHPSHGGRMPTTVMPWISAITPSTPTCSHRSSPVNHAMSRSLRARVPLRALVE
jgi:hypothetical protein